MEIYVITLMVLYGFVVLVELVNNEGRAALSSVLTIMVYLPLFGRILGWW